MAFLNASRGPPPGSPGSVIQACPLPHGYLCITVRNRHANGAPPLVDTDVSVTVGNVARELTTDGQGQVTFDYNQAADFAQEQVRVVLRDAARAWVGNAAAVGGGPVAVQGRDNATVTQVTVQVGGTFTLSVRVLTRKPGTGVVHWRSAYAAQLPRLHRASTPDGGVAVETDTNFAAAGDPLVVSLGNIVLPCMDVHVLSVALNGSIDDDSEAAATVDGVVPRTMAGANDATVANVTFRRLDGNEMRLQVARHGAAVLVEFLVVFPRILIVGEGTSYEYAVGLAARYGDALAQAGFRWVVVTQYDVTDPAAVSQDMTIRNPTTGVRQHHQNQRQRLAGALAKNLVRRVAQFDATDAAHWQAVLALGPFDAIVFNNPHPGYGMHMCLVMGLTDWNQQPGLSEKNGKAVSVYSFGYNGALRRDQLNALLGPANHLAAQGVVESRGRQRTFVRTGGVGCLNHQNGTAQAVAFQWDPVDTTPLALTVNDVFVYAEDGAPLAQEYGDANEFANNNATRHYASMVDAIGLQEYLLRCYRYHGPGVLKQGGSLYVNGSATWAGRLEAGFGFTDNGVVHNVTAMQNHAAWPAVDTFVYYNTNFTSLTHHPSWYSKWDFAPGEPNIANARAYRWVKP